VTLIDNEPDLDRKLSSDEWRLPSGLPFNYANRPGLLRILRNPYIRCLHPVEIVSLKHSPQGFSARLKSVPTYIDPERCTLCGRCQEICPLNAPGAENPIRVISHTSIPGRPVIEKGPKPLCQSSCPLGVNAQGYIALARAGRYREALELVRRDNILPGICGRVCTHPCEASCRRSELDSAVSLKNIKRFLADYELSEGATPAPPETQMRKEKVAVIGSGPAGLAASADLARLGYQVTVFEREDKAGGLLRYAIGQHRLPRDILDNELNLIQRLGVTLATSHSVDLSGDLKELRDDFNAAIVATGAWSDRRLGVPGEDTGGVEGCISFLTAFHRGSAKAPRGNVAVIGDGNAAFDLARILKRLGADVTILSWFPEELIPADPDEIRGAKEEGILIRDRMQVVAFSGNSGRMDRLACKPTEPGPPDIKGIPWPVIVPDSELIELAFNNAFVAIGQKGPFTKENPSSAFDVSTNGLIDVDAFSRTSVSWVFAAGDGVTGASSVVEAMASGRAAARSVHRFLSGEAAAFPATSRPGGNDFRKIADDIPSAARPEISERQPAARSGNFNEVSLGLNKSQVQLEAERCLQCGICSECLLCTEACGAVDAVRHMERPEEIIENGGVIIVADPNMAPNVKGEDVIRAYGPHSARTDVNAMYTRGYAAAAKSLILLGGPSMRPKGQGVFVPHPNPELSPKIRVGVFVCRCNDTFGWLEDMNDHVSQLIGKEDVIHAEVLTSACVPEGTASILRTIREKSITRVVLASCVCCPLDFICSACTDQRTRLKYALFKGAEVSRSMLEMCNLRGEALRHLKHDPATAMTAFKGLIYRSVHRARKLRPLPNPARTYNFATAVIGDSGASISSAIALADAGCEVLVFGTPAKPLSVTMDHNNIHCFADSMVMGLSGNLGNFRVLFETPAGNRILHVGAVIVEEKTSQTIPYSPQEGLIGTDVISTTQKRDITGVPFLFPGTTSVKGLFVADLPGIHVSERKKGAAAAMMALSIMPKGPRPSKGYTVVIDKLRCRGCGRCVLHCPYQAVVFKGNSLGGWTAEVDEALCKGCGNCISVCPTNAADSPYRNQSSLEQMIEEVLAL
jgi:NADPH-dependent glutamate synthase beta subunit-like oxidoreductase/NAD-dependent dihydropyrimidine dehydrogenase PreA subunit